jgi:hypothetical protein
VYQIGMSQQSLRRTLETKGAMLSVRHLAATMMLLPKQLQVSTLWAVLTTIPRNCALRPPMVMIWMLTRYVLVQTAKALVCKTMGAADTELQNASLIL